MSIIVILTLTLTLGASLSASQPEFRNINCGGEAFEDPNTTLIWDVDPFNQRNDVLKYGAIGKVDSSINVMKTLRYFPNYSRNRKFCYPFDVSSGRKYLLRASFLYGNYDGRNQPPTFHLIFNYDIWINVTTTSLTTPTMHELIFESNEHEINICLAPINSNYIPFISTLQLRRLDNTMYNVSGGALASGYGLMLWRRINYGATTNAEIRHPGDQFDRIWEANTTGPTVSTSTSNVGTYYESDLEKPPVEVMATAITTNNSTANLSFTYDEFGGVGGLLIELHFQEVDETLPGQSQRSLGFAFASGFFDGYYKSSIGGPNRIRYDQQAEWPFPLQFTLVPGAGSPRGPLLNAIELFNWTSQPLSASGTFQGDVDAIRSFRDYFNVTSGYGQGDPCFPKGYAWTWIECNEDTPPRITKITLQSFNLIGNIPPSITDLTGLETIDLSNNSLSGHIPTDIKLLTQLKYLRLHDNNLNGELPQSLVTLHKLATLDVSNNDLCGPVLTFQLSTNFTYTGNKRLCNISECSCNSTSSPNSPMMPTKNNHTREYIFAISFVGAICIVLMLLLLGVVYKARHNRSKGVVTTKQKGVDDFKGLTFMSKMFTYEEIRNATLDFTTLLGQGGFGKVYHGLLPTGEEIAVKMLVDASRQGLKEFYNEVAILSKVRHKNLVSLIGYCVEDTYMLVYEYIAKGNLRDLLYGDVKSEDKPLPWTTRLQVAADASQGLEYLHMGCDPVVIHRDVKSSNILLSDKMQAKVADFGLSRLKEGDPTISHVSTANVVGTVGYLDPEYNSTNQLTDKSDVYSFGVVLFELICGRSPIDMFSSPPHIVDWARRAIVQGKIEDIVDPTLAKAYKVESMWKVIDVAIGCTQNERVN